jgi:hypothetical protein
MPTLDWLCVIAFVLWPAASAAAVARRSRWAVAAIGLLQVSALATLAMIALELPLPFAALLILSGGAAGFTAGVVAAIHLPRLTLPALALSVALSSAVSVAWALGALHPSQREETVETTVVLSTTAIKAWDSLKGFGALSGERSLLMRLGLPQPQRCLLDGEGVGARRVCYFDKGSVEQRVLHWEPPRRLELAVVETQFPFRPFSFSGASYELSEEGGLTRVRRTTTLTSRLAPRWLWRPVEHAMVQSEHHYLLDELRRRFAGKI